MATKTKIVLVLGEQELARLQKIVARQNDTLRSAGILRSASLSDAARSMMAFGLRHEPHSMTYHPTADTTENRPEEADLFGVVAKPATAVEPEAQPSVSVTVSELRYPADRSDRDDL